MLTTHSILPTKRESWMQCTYITWRIIESGITTPYLEKLKGMHTKQKVFSYLSLVFMLLLLYL